MTSYRKMRRQARHARRSGLQPMMVINSGDQLPESLAVAALRWAWRYRSELAPAYAGALLLAAGWWLHATHRHAWPVPAVARRGGRLRAGHRRRESRAGRRHRTAVRGHAHAGRRGMAGRLGHPRPGHAAAAASPHRRRPGAVGAVVGAPAPARQGPHRTQARGVARHRPRGRPARLPGHVRCRGRVGLAVAAAAGARPDHHRRDRPDSRAGIGAGHLPGRGPRLPDPGRPGQPVRTAGAGHRPARRRDHLARPVGDLDHRADRPRPVRGRRPLPGVVPAPSRPGRRQHRLGQERRPERASWATWWPAPTWSSGPSTSSAAWN